MSEKEVERGELERVRGRGREGGEQGEGERERGKRVGGEQKRERVVGDQERERGGDKGRARGWRKQEYLEKTTDPSQVTDKLYQVHLA